MPTYRDPDPERDIQIQARDKYEAEQFRKKLAKLICQVCRGKGMVVGQKDAAGIGRWTICPKCKGRCYNI